AVEVHRRHPLAAIAGAGREDDLRAEEAGLAGEVLDDLVAPHVRELADVLDAALVGALEHRAVALLDLVQLEVDGEAVAAHLGAELHHPEGARLAPLDEIDAEPLGAQIAAVGAGVERAEPAG